MSTDNFDKDIQDVQNTNPEQVDHTEKTDQTNQEAALDIDYKVKFGESSKEALRLLEEKKLLEKENAELKAQKELGETHTPSMENLYPGFEDLDDAAKANIIALSEGIVKRTREDFNKDPAIAFARKNYNETVFDKALSSVISKYPELEQSKDEFKSKYFNANNVPTNIDSILDDVAKIHLFDKQRVTGTQDEKDKESHIDTERNTGGDRNVKTSRTLDDWRRMSEQNPQKFAQLSKEYHKDLESGKLK